jgi:hypothetical protein
MDASSQIMLIWSKFSDAKNLADNQKKVDFSVPRHYFIGHMRDRVKLS